MISNKKYSLIYADPPWSYTDKRDKPGPSGNTAGSASAHYPTMSIKDIKALPVSDIADDPCILFMWCTFPLMPIWNEVITGWGFQYKTLGFSWVKTYPKSGTHCIGAGAYTRSNNEVCLIAVKGKGASLIQDHSICNVVEAPRERHSAKPQIFRDKIVQLCGDIPRIELFARNTTPGWDVWGNEV
jgi:N6-adenosine-specific RNA methylase IME4